MSGEQQTHQEIPLNNYFCGSQSESILSMILTKVYMFLLNRLDVVLKLFTLQICTLTNSMEEGILLKALHSLYKMHKIKIMHIFYI